MVRVSEVREVNCRGAPKLANPVTVTMSTKTGWPGVDGSVFDNAAAVAACPAALAGAGRLISKLLGDLSDPGSDPLRSFPSAVPVRDDRKPG